MKSSCIRSVKTTIGIVALGLISGFAPANGKLYEIPEIEASISLSEIWIPVNHALVQAYNDDLVRRRPQTRLRFVAGFTRGTPSDPSDVGSDYIWIQRTPPTAAPVSPEQVVSMLPKVVAKNKQEFERLLKDKVASIDSGAAHYEERLGAVVWNATDTLPDGGVVPMRCYLIVTKTCWISINAYATPTSSEAVFGEVQGIVSTLQLKDEQKMPSSWWTRIKALLGGNP